jgi:chromosome segregation ATPase
MLPSQFRWVSVAGVAGLCFLAGCAGVPTESAAGKESTASTESPAAASADSAADKPAISESAVASATPVAEPRSSWRESRNTETRAAASESRSESPRPSASSTASARESTTTSGENANLVTQLNDASRELATLRAANARLRAERDRPVAAPRASEPATRADPVDEKIAASLKSYATLKQELTSFLTEIERGRAENAAASAKLKDAVSRSDDARAAVARLEAELRAEKRARADAEQTAAKLQEQLRTIARALANAGINVDKLAAGTETGSRRETSR